MDKNLKGILWISFIVIVFGGFVALKKLWSSVLQLLLMLLPVFGENIIENYFTSPYFIVGVIMAICSSVGIYFGVKGGKKLYIIISLIVLILDLISMGRLYNSIG